MLASAETVQVVADAFRRYSITTSVVDPVCHSKPTSFCFKQLEVKFMKLKSTQVMVSTSGSQLLPETAVSTLIDELLPFTSILTPNLSEALRLLSIAGIVVKNPETIDDFIKIAMHIRSLGPKWVLLKGGHLPFTKEGLASKGVEGHEVVLNVLVGDGGVSLMENKYLHCRNTHGTGCSLASAIACNLAAGMSMAKAVKKATLYIEAGIKTSTDLGQGSGPINHFHSTYTLPFIPGSFIAYLLDREDVQAPWKEYTMHPFVQQMGDGTLPVEKFMYYLVQDYLFLVLGPAT